MSNPPTRILEHESQRLEALDGPALLVSAGASPRLLAANRSGLAALGLETLPSGGIALDRATPAIARLGEAGGAGSQPFVFWINGQPRTLVAVAEPVASIGSHVWRLASEATAHKSADPPSAEAEPASEQAQDARTLAEIARRIREGLGGGLSPADPRPQRAGGAVPASGTEPASDAAEPSDALKAWPGLRVVSERDLATLAHEIRTPLAAIRAMAEAIRDERLGPIGNARYAEYAADIFNSADHAIEVLGAMVTDQPVLKVMRIDPHVIILACLSELRPLAQRSGLILSTSLAAGLPPILADARTIKQILLNLLSNAIRHTPPGGEVLVSTAYRVDGPIRIEVRDTGAGIAPEDIARVEAESEADGQGLPPMASTRGIGLPLVRRLAGLNGAELGIDSRPGHGTRVFLTFGHDRVATAS